MMLSRRWTEGGPAASLLSVMLLVGSLLFCASASGQDSNGSGLEKLRLRGEDPSMTRIVPDTPPDGIPPFPEFHPVQKTVAARRIKLNGREAFIPANIWIHPNPLMSQTEISVITHPMNPDVVFIGSNSILSGRDSIIFGSQGWYHTSDAGVSWTGSDTFPTHGSSGSFLADPAVNIDLDSNLFFGAIRFRSDNDVVIDRAASANGPWYESSIPEVTEAEDKQHTVVDRSIISPYRNTLYTVYTDFDSSRNPYPLMFSRSTDRGVGFSRPVIISERIGEAFAQGGNIVTGPLGELYVAWSGYDDWPPPVKTRIGFNKSTDGGTTWFGARSLRTIDDIRGFLYKGRNILRVNSFPSLAVDISDGPRRGWIYLVYSERNPVVKVWMMRSTDGGESWSEPIKVGRELPRQINDQWFPWACVDPATGALYIVYYDSRNSVDNDSTDVFVSTSVDGGEEFEDVRVNDVSFVPTVVPGAAYGYMGDYIGIAALNGIVWPSWNDNRTGIHQAYTSRLEFQTITSDLRLSASPETVTFGRVFSRFSDSTQCRLRNLGISDTLEVTGISSSSSWISVESPSLRIPPGKSIGLTVIVNAQALGVFSESLTVTSNDPELPMLRIPVRGEAISPPFLSLAPDSMDAVLSTGDTVLRTVSVLNSGAGDLRINLATSIIWMDAIPRATVVPPGDSMLIDVRLKSGELNDGNYRSYITLTSNDPSSPLRLLPVTLRIKGIPRVEPESPAMRIGDVAVGYQRSVNFRINNTGTFPLVASGFEILAPGFQITAPETLRIAPHSSKSIEIRFAPAVEESVNTLLRFDTNDPDNPEVGIGLSVFGYLPPRISVTPESFTIVTYRDNAYSALISLFNTGIGTLHWRASQYPAAAVPAAGEPSQVTPSGTNAPWVTLFPDEGSIASGRSGALEMRIDARTLLFRSYLVELIVSSNDPDRPTVRLQVIVTVQRIPNITLAPNVVTFTNAFISYPDTAQFSVRNATANTLIISEVTSDNPRFALADSLPFIVAPRSDRVASISFTPTGPEIEIGKLLFTTSDRVNPVLSLAVQGTGVLPPAFSISPDSAVDPEIYSGGTVTRTILITNGGNSDMKLNAAVLPLRSPLIRSADAPASISSQTVYLPYTLRDSFGYKWDIQKDGSILDGTDDAFDGGFRLDGFGSVAVATVEDEGRELVLGPFRVGTLTMTRKIFVSEKSGFIRYLELIQNDNILPVNVDLLVYSNLGSDLASSLLQTSSGDSILEVGDNWVITDDEPDAGDPAVVQVLSDDAYHQRPSEVSASVGVGNISFSYRISLPPQSRAIVMHFGAQRRNSGEAEIIASNLAGLREDALYGMSQEERRLVINFGLDLICSVTPPSLRIAPGTGASLSLVYNGDRLPEGLYHPTLQMRTNVPWARLVQYPLTLKVNDAPHIPGVPDTLRFRAMIVEMQDTAAIALHNSGSLALVISDASFSHPDFRILTSLPLAIAKGETDSLRIEFMPARAGSYTETLTMQTNDPLLTTVSVNLQARAVDRPVVTMSVDTLRLLGEAGETPSANIGIRNTGAGPFRYSAKALISGVEEAQEGTSMWEVPDFRTRGNIYRVTSPTVLQEFRVYLDIQVPLAVDFVICEAKSIDGMYRVQHRLRDTITTFGQRMVSSGPIGMTLATGSYYFIGVSVHDGATSYFRIAPFLVPVSFGEIVSAGLSTMMNIPDSLLIRRQTYTLFHQSIITNPIGCVPTIVPANGDVAAGDSATLSIALPFAFPSGEYRGTVHFNTINPERTLASLPVIARLENPLPPVPAAFALLQNYPNPFNMGTVIRYQLEQKSRVTLIVFNVLGQTVERIVNDRVEDQGMHVVRWEAARSNGSHASGVYFYRLDASPISPGGRSYTEIRKMLLLK